MTPGQQYSVERATEILSRTPGVLRQLLEGLSDSWLHCDEGSGTWSPHQVLGHLIQGERKDWILRARVMLEQGDAVTFEPFDRFAHLELAKEHTTGEMLDEFETLRRENLETLERWKLSDAELARPGRHPEFGPVELRQHLATWVAHDLSHIGQIARIMAKQYDDAVGPWKKYLRILQV
ncbi:MAG: DinB family protein [Gemmatimonadales bacterium]